VETQNAEKWKLKMDFENSEFLSNFNENRCGSQLLMHLFSSKFDQNSIFLNFFEFPLFRLVSVRERALYFMVYQKRTEQLGWPQNQRKYSEGMHFSQHATVKASGHNIKNTAKASI